MSGIMINRCIEDEIMVAEIGKTANSIKSIVNNSRVIILDARPKLNAQANRLKSGGFEDLRFYRNCDI